MKIQNEAHTLSKYLYILRTENTQHIFSFLLGSFSVFQCRGVSGGQPLLTMGGFLMACDGVHLPQWEDFSWEVVVTSHEKI